MDKWSEYFIDDTNVLKNKLGIVDSLELRKIENKILLTKLTILYIEPIEGNFDVKHLCDIHKFLFEDIYEFAGQFRNVNMTKNNAYFEDYLTINYRLNYSLSQMNEEIKNNCSKEYYAYFLAGFYYELIMAHPFREGNGRTIREFIREFVNKKIFDYELDFERMDATNLLFGVKDRILYPSLLEQEFSKALLLKEKEHIKNIK